MKYLFCKDNTGKIDNNEKNRKQCLSFNEDWDWELPGINKWIYFAENKIELFVDNAQRDALKAGEDIEVDPKDAFHYDFDFRIAEEWELGFDEWYDNNSAIDQLITSRLDNYILGDDFDSFADDDRPLEHLVKIFGDFIVQIEEDEERDDMFGTYELRCSRNGVELIKM